MPDEVAGVGRKEDIKWHILCLWAVKATDKFSAGDWYNWICVLDSSLWQNLGRQIWSSWEVTEIVQGRDDEGLNQGSNSRNGEKRMDSRNVWKIKSSWFSEGEQGVRMTHRFLIWMAGRRRVAVTIMGEGESLRGYITNSDLYTLHFYFLWVFLSTCWTYESEFGQEEIGMRDMAIITEVIVKNYKVHGVPYIKWVESGESWAVMVKRKIIGGKIFETLMI